MILYLILTVIAVLLGYLHIVSIASDEKDNEQKQVVKRKAMKVFALYLVLMHFTNSSLYIENETISGVLSLLFIAVVFVIDKVIFGKLSFYTVATGLFFSIISLASTGYFVSLTMSVLGF